MHLASSLGLLQARSHGGRREAQHILNLLGRVILAASKNVRFGASLVADFMHLDLSHQVSRVLGRGCIGLVGPYHRAEGDETDKRVLRKQAQAHHQRLLE